jgi:hypothetical protein
MGLGPLRYINYSFSIYFFKVGHNNTSKGTRNSNNNKTNKPRRSLSNCNLLGPGPKAGEIQEMNKRKLVS